MGKIKRWFKNLMLEIGILKMKRKSTILKAVLDNPENVKLEAYIEDDEIIVKIKKREREYL